MDNKAKREAAEQEARRYDALAKLYADEAPEEYRQKAALFRAIAKDYED